MKKEFVIICLVLILSLGIVSASWFSDLITGNAVKEKGNIKIADIQGIINFKSDSKIQPNSEKFICNSDKECRINNILTPYCDRASKICKECKSNNDCKKTWGTLYPYCGNGSCKGCLSNEECSKIYGSEKSFCTETLYSGEDVYVRGHCAECKASSDCANGMQCIDILSECWKNCASDEECKDISGNPYCIDGFCRECNYTSFSSLLGPSNDCQENQYCLIDGRCYNFCNSDIDCKILSQASGFFGGLEIGPRCINNLCQCNSNFDCSNDWSRSSYFAWNNNADSPKCEEQESEWGVIKTCKQAPCPDDGNPEICKKFSKGNTGGTKWSFCSDSRNGNICMRNQCNSNINCPKRMHCCKNSFDTSGFTNYCEVNGIECS